MVTILKLKASEAAKLSEIGVATVTEQFLGNIMYEIKARAKLGHRFCEIQCKGKPTAVTDAIVALLAAEGYTLSTNGSYLVITW